MPVITQEDPATPDASSLIEELDAVLEPLYAVESRHGFSVSRLVAQGVVFFVLRHQGQPAGCGGVMLVGTEYGEIKRMYVRPAYRGLGFGKLILDHLAQYAARNGVSLLRLETGIHQLAAIRLYEQEGFRRIPPFGPYREDPVSLCYEKRLSSLEV